MGKTQNQPNGFALIEALVIILILAVIGFGGYYVWHTQYNIAKPAATKSTTKTPGKSTTSSPIEDAAAVKSLVNSFYTSYIPSNSTQVVQQYGTANLINYANKSYNENPIVCAQNRPPSFMVGSVQTGSTSASAMVTETFNDPVKINVSVVNQNGVLKIESVTCPPGLTQVDSSHL